MGCLDYNPTTQLNTQFELIWTTNLAFPNLFTCTFNYKLPLISLHDMDSLEDDFWSGVNGFADFVVGREGEDLGPTASPHRPAVQQMHGLAETHDRRVDVSHSESFNWLTVLLLERGEQEENEGPNCCWIQCCTWENDMRVTTEQNDRTLNSD